MKYLIFSLLFVGFGISNAKDLTNVREKEIVYLVHSGMPLSLTGIPEVQQLCKATKASCIFLHSEFMSNTEIDRVHRAYKIATTPFISQDYEDLVEAGFGLHFPSLAFINFTKSGNPKVILGYKNFVTYKQMFRKYITGGGGPTIFSKDTPIKKIDSRNDWTLEKQIKFGDLEWFFKPLAIDPMKIFVSGIILDLNTKLKYKVTGSNMEPAVSADGKFLFNHNYGGNYYFYKTAECLKTPNIDCPKFIEPIKPIPITYPSLGTLPSLDGTQTTYRLLASQNSTYQPNAIVFRDFHHSIATDDFVMEAGRKFICNGDAIYSLPFISKDGRYLSAHVDMGVEGSKSIILEIGESGLDCNPVMIFPPTSSKMDFSPDSKFITYVSFDRVTQVNSLYVLDIDNKIAHLIYEAPKGVHWLVFPVLHSSDEIVVRYSVRTDPNDVLSMVNYMLYFKRK